jgi:hypothetical protein
MLPKLVVAESLGSRQFSVEPAAEWRAFGAGAYRCTPHARLRWVHAISNGSRVTRQRGSQGDGGA